MFGALHWFHAAFVVVLGVLHFWFWAKSGFKVPFYVHVMAFLGFAAGVALVVTTAQIGVAKPTFGSWLSTLMFPVIVYVAFVFYGGATAAPKRKKLPTPKPPSSLQNKNPFEE